MDKNLRIENILDPISPEKFFKEYWNKKHLIIRRNKFKNLFTWNDLDNHLNLYPRINDLQILDYDGKNTRWCLDKVRSGKLKLPMLNKSKLFELWKIRNKSIVLPFAEYQNKDLLNICFEFERFFGRGQANVYASPGPKSKSFPAHQDDTENFLFHTEGKTKWTIYKEFAPAKPKEILEEFVLEAGDLLYIPQFQFHKVDVIEPRILISVHFHNKERQTLKQFKVTPNAINKRDQWYSWRPELYDEKGIKKDFPYKWRDNSPTWKKKYL